MMRRRSRRRHVLADERGFADERGMVTVEAAIAIAAIVAVMVMGAISVVAVAAHVRCIDAAREGARIAAQGDSATAKEVATRAGPRGASVSIRTEGDLVIAVVRVDVPLMPGLDVGAKAVAAVEPGGGE